MNLFQTVKYGASCREAAERYGVSVNRQGKALCPFHNDRHPSLYVADNHYYCFACGEHGDVIDFVSKLFQLSLYDAARKLERTFTLPRTSRPTATAATRMIRTSGFWTRKLRRLSSASLTSVSTAKVRSRFPGFLSAIRFLRPRLCMPAARESRCPRIRMDGRINPLSGFWNGRNTSAAPVTSRPTPSPTS